MQLQGLIMMLFFTIVIPIIIMSANHDVFFILIAMVLLIASLKDSKNIIMFLKNGSNEPDGEDTEDLAEEKEMIEELEQMTNINVKKFNTGIGFVKSLILILFFLYCAVYMNNIYFRVIIAALLLYWIRQTISLVLEKSHSDISTIPLKLQFIISLIVDIATIIIIIVIAYNKYFVFMQ